MPSPARPRPTRASPGSGSISSAVAPDLAARQCKSTPNVPPGREVGEASVGLGAKGVAGFRVVWGRVLLDPAIGVVLLRWPRGMRGPAPPETPERPPRAESGARRGYASRRQDRSNPQRSSAGNGEKTGRKRRLPGRRPCSCANRQCPSRLELARRSFAILGEDERCHRASRINGRMITALLSGYLRQRTLVLPPTGRGWIAHVQFDGRGYPKPTSGCFSRWAMCGRHWAWCGHCPRIPDPDIASNAAGSHRRRGPRQLEGVALGKPSES